MVVGEVSRKLLAQGGAQSALPHPSPCALPPYTSSPLSPPGVLAVQLGCLLKKPGGQGNLFSTMHTHSDKPPPTPPPPHTHWAVGKGCGEEFLSPDPSPAARKRLWTMCFPWMSLHKFYLHRTCLHRLSPGQASRECGWSGCLSCPVHLCTVIRLGRTVFPLAFPTVLISTYLHLIFRQTR